MILTEEIENSLKNEADIDDLLKQIHDMDFSEYIHHLFKKYHLKEADIIRKSGLERTYAYKIIRGEKGKNAKDKIYRLALAMNLTQKETNHLLSLNNAYYLVLSFGTEILSHFCDSFYKLRVVVEIWFLIVSLEFCHF